MTDALEVLRMQRDNARAELDNLHPLLRQATDLNRALASALAHMRDERDEWQRRAQNCRGCADRNAALDEFAAALDDL